MYNSVPELHIGLDLALQQLNSNRKQVVKPEEKDWFLNETMLQVINNHIDPSPIIPGRTSDSDQRTVDYLHPLKMSLKYVPPVFRRKADDTYRISLPADYYRKSRINACVTLKKNGVSSGYNTIRNTRLLKAVIAFAPRENVSLQTYITDFRMLVANHPVFNAGASTYTGSGISKYDFSNIRTKEALFMMIPTILESINANNWVSAYWESYNGVAYPKSFIIVVDKEAYQNAFGASISSEVAVNITAGEHIINAPLALEPGEIVVDEISKIIPVRIVESAHYDNVMGNSFFDSSYHSIAGVIEAGQVILKPAEYFTISIIDMVYYRKPRLINYRTGQNCEITAPDFKVQLVGQTAQKINAFLNGENYNQMTKENLMLL